MLDLFHAVLFTALIGALGLGLASIVMTIIPVRSEEQSAEELAKTRVEYAFFGFAGVVVAFVMWVGMWLS
ncbi:MULTISPECIES: hypothetical protein [Gammaproteobacteria]|uniref:hypothetical protein n=1 Tax=Gammaproteobacteria TaxID=1236 RepID=UPI000DD0E3C4|nr:MULTISPECIES: hypothetical protein [Gammaproteobacteria]RTE87450.1 hypothetical protein DQX04_03440 [Aliidiomarina sp. B3213]TCZ92765.1 hypothetical protein EYQ95_01865 [Lysobacter sp. N42]